MAKKRVYIYHYLTKHTHRVILTIVSVVFNCYAWAACTLKFIFMEKYVIFGIAIVDACVIGYAWFFSKHKSDNMAEAFTAQLAYDDWAKDFEASYGQKPTEKDGIKLARQNREQKSFMVLYGLAMIHVFSLFAIAGLDRPLEGKMPWLFLATIGGIVLLLNGLILQADKKWSAVGLISLLILVSIPFKLGFDWLLIYDWKILLAIIGIAVAWSLTAIYHQGKRKY